MINKYSFLLLIAVCIGANVFGQSSQSLSGQDTTRRAIITPVSFLTISPDARSGALGDAGVAISPDANAIYWNPAKLAFLDKKFGLSVNYTPWLRNLVNDMSISTLNGYYKVDNNQAIGVNLTYFNLGDIQFTDENGNPIRDFNSREFAIGGTYSRKLSNNLGLAVALRFIHSNLAGNFNFVNTVGQVKAGNTASGDVALYYNKDLNISGNDVNFAFGANLSNLGAKISYTTRDQREFIPTNLKVGTGITLNADPYNKITWALDFNKLLVPTPNANGTRSNKTFISGALGSFGDAPDGISEELEEVSIATGLEYWYNDLFSARAGYFSESRDKGNRKYFTLGVGIRYQKLGFDFAYLIPQQKGANSPLADTLRFTLHLNFGQSNQEEAPVSE
ncbi:type IX secretion system outer membrane channel protein PorV [Rhodocytophaga rosea]|uniref:Type IX secretion system outer membrane channel protein PorV n=1 Tax=Rhodocytophaga rosea TaxID=2704465 RepID=A0A6C0GQ58_9BACT|nr:type IX secretion system outer membrane channel protein PorV [Rhodocytophaga rosea]QHT70191.1 type IX secretion system outer membrane channel protein PorV [Rhodocytophaga rosea]